MSNFYNSLLLLLLRKIYLQFKIKKKNNFKINKSEAIIASNLIFKSLSNDKPCAIVRFGANELNLIRNYQGIISKKKSIIDFIKGNIPPWWWHDGILKKFIFNAGFFPNNKDLLNKYCELSFLDMKEIDILGDWGSSVDFNPRELKNVKRIKVEYLEPYFSNNPWTKVLKNKKVLVIHPFSKSIEKQYKKRRFLFKDNLLPNFHLKTLKSVQSIAGEKTKFKDWFEALEFMKKQMNKLDFDIALVGCGAYGMPLAIHAKKLGKKGFHLGGALQVLFGIIGKRYENANQSGGVYQKLINKHWVRPSLKERPNNYNKIEKGGYW